MTPSTSINGAPCRLLDIQELLSDTGIGRQQHVIVGQGQLDAVLNARPEDRRAIVEEAAGILKFRKRRERAERRLEATEGNLLRLNDLLREVRRQLTPLQTQADAARRHGGVVDELRAIRIHLAGHEIAGLQARDRAAARRRGAELAAREAERARAAARPRRRGARRRARARPRWATTTLADWLVRVESMRERGRGLARARSPRSAAGVERELAAAADEGVVETLVADADALRGELATRRDARSPTAARRRPTCSSTPRRRRSAPADAALARRRSRTRRAGVRAPTRSTSGSARRAPPPAPAQLADVDGVVGPLVDQLEIEAGHGSRGRRGARRAMRAVVVRGGDAALDAVARLQEGEATGCCSSSTTIGAPGQPRLVAARHPAAGRLRPHARCPARARARPAARRRGRWSTPAGAPRSSSCSREPELVVVTATATASAARPRGGSAARGDAAVTQAALEEALARAADAEVAREREAEARGRARARRARRRARSSSGAATSRPSTGARCSHERLASVEARLARARRRRAGRAPSAQRRALVGATRVAYEEIGARLDALRRACGRAARPARASVDGASRATRARVGASSSTRCARERAQLERELLEVRERAPRAEIDDAETRLRLETAVERLRTDYDVEPAVALDAPAPEVPDGTTLAGRARELERELRLMGPINPLALEEHDALAGAPRVPAGAARRREGEPARAQPRDPRRRPARSSRCSSSAFDDVSRALHRPVRHAVPRWRRPAHRSPTPTTCSNTGIEMEARPSGKNVRRLSLLSGGERSLTALAFLFAVFRARPSPFYLMDEVEAALDDVNLHRFLDLVHEFRDEAQLLIVSHQKRTMEAADCLYGVSMPPGGSSRVVSQRVRDDDRRAGRPVDADVSS